MRIIKTLCFSLLFTLFLTTPVFAWTTTVLYEGYSVPDDCWLFVGEGILEKNGVRLDVNNMISAKREETAKELENIVKAGFKDAKLSASLDGDYFLWDEDINGDYMSKDTGFKINVLLGGTTYNVYIPPGKVGSENVNQGSIARAVEAINLYKTAVLDGVTAGAMSSSFNVYTGYSDKQLAIGIPHSTDGADNVTNGVMIIQEGTGGHIFGGNGSSDIKYSLNYFYNPLFGKMEVKDLPKNDKMWREKTTLTNLNITNNTVQVIINPDFIKFCTLTSDIRKGIMEASGVVATSSDGVPPYKMGTTDYKPIDLVDYNMRVITPAVFTEKEGGKFGLIEDGFTLLDDKIRICLYDDKVYELSDDGKNVSIGGIGEFSGLTGEYLALYHYNIDGNIVGAVIPLKYREAVANTTADGDKVYLTGRDVVFNNNYSGNLKYDSPNPNMMDVMTDIGGKSGAFARDFAFTPATSLNVSSKETHKQISGNPIQKFQFAYSFQKGDTEGVNKGFVIYRNNAFINDQSLIQWLSSDNAISLTNIKAEELYEKITGVFSIGDGKISYDDWQKIQKIKERLSADRQGTLAFFIRVTALIFGILLIIYSLLLMLAYWIDIFNSFFDFSLLNVMTFMRLYPVTSSDDITYLRSTNGDVKYVTFIDMLKIMLVGCFIGTLFLTYTPILTFFFNIYFYVTTHLGGV